MKELNMQWWCYIIFCFVSDSNFFATDTHSIPCLFLLRQFFVACSNELQNLPTKRKHNELILLLCNYNMYSCIVVKSRNEIVWLCTKLFYMGIYLSIPYITKTSFTLKHYFLFCSKNKVWIYLSLTSHIYSSERISKRII